MMVSRVFLVARLDSRRTVVNARASSKAAPHREYKQFDFPKSRMAPRGGATPADENAGAPAFSSAGVLPISSGFQSREIQLTKAMDGVIPEGKRHPSLTKLKTNV